jgi:hypothetical protein
VSLEGLSEAQIKQLATGMHQLLQSNNSEVRRGAQRLLKRVDPNLNFPEIELDEAISAAVKPLQEDNEKLRNDLKERDFKATVSAEHERVRQRGFKVEDVQKFMTERGIVNFDTAMNVLDMEQRLATPTPEAVSGVYELPEKSKEIFTNPAQWARRTAHQVIDEFKNRKRA